MPVLTVSANIEALHYEAAGLPKNVSRSYCAKPTHVNARVSYRTSDLTNRENSCLLVDL